MRSRALALIVALFVAFGATRGFAVERCAPIAGGDDALTDRDPGERLNFIQQHVNRDARNVRIWAWSWATIYSGLLVFNSVRLANSTLHKDIIDNSAAVAATGFGLVVLTIMPPAVLRDQKGLARIVARSSFAADRCESVAAAEKILLRDAASESFGRGPLVHAGNFVFNMGLGLLLGVGFRHWQTGAIVATTGIAIGELQQLTIRTHLNDTLARYRRGELDSRSDDKRERTPLTWMIVPTIGQDHYGAQFGLAF